LEEIMSEKQSSFTVTDRRKFTLDGELRDNTGEDVFQQAAAPAIAP
jgi:hypothetical protein